MVSARNDAHKTQYILSVINIKKWLWLNRVVYLCNFRIAKYYPLYSVKRNTWIVLARCRAFIHWAYPVLDTNKKTKRVNILFQPLPAMLGGTKTGIIPPTKTLRHKKDPIISKPSGCMLTGVITGFSTRGFSVLCSHGLVNTWPWEGVVFVWLLRSVMDWRGKDYKSPAPKKAPVKDQWTLLGMWCKKTCIGDSMDKTVTGVGFHQTASPNFLMDTCNFIIRHAVFNQIFGVGFHPI